MNIVQTPNEVLNKPAAEVEAINTHIRRLIQEMIATLRESEIGVGLAAPQVGVSLRIFVASEHMPDSAKKENEPVLVCINPRILSKSKKKSGDKSKKRKKNEKLEGCLSMQNIWGPVNRAESVKIAYTDENGTDHVKTFSGFMATIVQHEIDHLDGILFTQRVLEQGGTLYRENTANDQFEEIEI